MAATTITAARACSACAAPSAADRTLFRDAAREIKAILDEEGVGHMPVGVDVVEPPMLFELQKAGIEVRDGQQTMLHAREIKSHDEITLLNMAAAMVDGVYQDIAEALKPGIKESEIVALAAGRLVRDGLGLRRGRSTRSPASAARRIRTTSRTA